MNINKFFISTLACIYGGTFFYPAIAMKICSTPYPYNNSTKSYDDLPNLHIGVYEYHDKFLTNIDISQANSDILEYSFPYFNTVFYGLKQGDIIPIRDDIYRITALWPAPPDDRYLPGKPPPPPGSKAPSACISAEKTSNDLLAGQKKFIILAQDSALYLWIDSPEAKITQIFFDKIEGENISLLWQTELQSEIPVVGKNHIYTKPYDTIASHQVTLKVGEYFSIPGYGKLKIIMVIPSGIDHKTWIMMDYIGM